MNYISKKKKSGYNIKTIFYLHFEMYWYVVHKYGVMYTDTSVSMETSDRHSGCFFRSHFHFVRNECVFHENQ